MSSSTLYRLSGISLLIGSLLTISGFIPDLIVEHSSGSTIAAASALLRLIGLMLVVLGLPGMYARQAERAGMLGLLGSTTLGIAVMRAAVLSRWAGLVLIAGEVVSLIGNFLRLGQSIENVGEVIFLVGLAWLAVGLLSKQPGTGEASQLTAGVRA